LTKGMWERFPKTHFEHSKRSHDFLGWAKSATAGMGAKQ
jgi:hypothetical protein